VDFQLTTDDIGRPVAILDFEAEAFGHWLSSELAGSAAKLQVQQIISALEQLEARTRWDYYWQGQCFDLQVEDTEVTLAHHSVLQGDELFDEYAEMELEDSDSGLMARCGLEDFTPLMLAWQRHLQECC